MALEEQDDGYLVVVDQCKPHLVDRAKKLQREHAIFREIVDRVVPSMERISADDRPRFERHCDELSELLNQIDRHDQRETDLLQEALYLDEGGEG
jgi:hemerythrin-like domain-containing protein